MPLIQIALLVIAVLFYLNLREQQQINRGIDYLDTDMMKLHRDAGEIIDAMPER